MHVLNFNSSLCNFIIYDTFFSPPPYSSLVTGIHFSILFTPDNVLFLSLLFYVLVSRTPDDLYCIMCEIRDATKRNGEEIEKVRKTAGINKQMLTEILRNQNKLFDHLEKRPQAALGSSVPVEGDNCEVINYLYICLITS